ncbi:hornerin-like [Palaemon carinicauda]|uniref:hornerin-like n=1 Tax=Palaemon carinicauda TaxID=392227 RepID=UPI0035B68E16
MNLSTIFTLSLLAAVTSAASLDGYTYQRTSNIGDHYGDSSRGFGPEVLSDQFSSTQGSPLSGALSHLTDSSGSLFDRTSGQSSLSRFESGRPSYGGTGFSSDTSTLNSDDPFGTVGTGFNPFAGTVNNIKPSPLNRYANSLSRLSEGGTSSRQGHHFDRQGSDGGNTFGGQLGSRQNSFGGQDFGNSINRQSPGYGKGSRREQPDGHLSSSGRFPSTSGNFFSRQTSTQGNPRQPFGQVSTLNENFDELLSAGDSFGGQIRGSSGSFVENPREYGNQFESSSDGQGISFDSTGYDSSCDEQPTGHESFTNEQPGYGSSFGGDFSDRRSSFTSPSPQLGHSFRGQTTQHGSSSGVQPTGALRSSSNHNFENTRTYSKPSTRFGSHFSGSSPVPGSPFGRQSNRSGNPLGGTPTRRESFHGGASTIRGSFSGDASGSSSDESLSSHYLPPN